MDIKKLPTQVLHILIIFKIRIPTDAQSFRLFQAAVPSCAYVEIREYNTMKNQTGKGVKRRDTSCTV